MRNKIRWIAAAVVSVSAVLSGCGVASGTSPVRVNAANQTTHQEQKANKQQTTTAKWVTVHVKQVTQLPTVTVGTSLTVDNGGNIVATGGYTGSVSLPSVLKVTPKVVKIANLPQLTHDAASGYIGPDLYVFGGGQAVSYNTIVRVDNGKAQTIGTLPRPLSDAVSVPWTYDGTQGLVLIGGYDGQTYRKNVDYYNVKSGHLESHTLFSLPIGLRYTAAIADNGALYFAGGQTPTTTSSVVYRWTPSTGVHVLTHLPEAIQKAAIFQADGFLVVAGGVTSAGHISSNIYAIRLSDGALKRIGALPTPLADMGYTQTGTTGYLVGGDTGSGYSSKVLEITLGQ